MCGRKNWNWWKERDGAVGPYGVIEEPRNTTGTLPSPEWGDGLCMPGKKTGARGSATGILFLRGRGRNPDSSHRRASFSVNKEIKEKL